MNVRQITVFIEDKPGTLDEIMTALTKKNIHIRAFTAVDMGGMTILRILVDNIMWTASLINEKGCAATFTDVFVAEVSNAETGLIKVLDILRDSGINIQHVYPVMSKNTRWIGREIYMVFEVNDNAKALEVLSENGIKTLTQEELSAL
ncbi:MAG: hypothetical protein IJG37_04670 [Synergistaceae bacterium]|nr:hypothetical protein [Synergistaceae bacterium]MBQ3653732.1 hypothetical protein [Synergistaceae bacterium]